MKTLRPFVLGALLASAAGLAGCKASDAPEAQNSAEATNAAPDAKPGVSAANGRLVLPAVAGRPGVAYFTVRNGTRAGTSLAAVHIDGAGKAEIHQTVGSTMRPIDQVEVGAGAQIAFEPGGLHVMVFDLDGKLKAGDETEMTLTFADGDKLSMPLKIEAMGSAAGAMGGMSH